MQKMSFCMDVKIICKTIGYVIRRDGIQEGRNENP
jgi:lipopolysaccharide/colanic/teichoic acid biosynthesis glycosyltransferase